MRKNPLNYLISFAITILLWIIIGIFIGDAIGENIILATLPVEDFLNIFRILLGIVAILSLILIFYWFYYGNKTNTAGELDVAKRKYIALFIAQIIFAIAMLITLIIILFGEGVQSSDYVVVLLLASVLTFILFWIITLFFSPKTVKFIPFLSKKIL